MEQVELLSPLGEVRALTGGVSQRSEVRAWENRIQATGLLGNVVSADDDVALCDTWTKVQAQTSRGVVWTGHSSRVDLDPSTGS